MGRRKCDRHRPHRLTESVDADDPHVALIRLVLGGVTDALYNPTVGEFYTAGGPSRPQGAPKGSWISSHHGSTRVFAEISKQTVKTWNANTGPGCHLGAVAGGIAIWYLCWRNSRKPLHKTPQGRVIEIHRDP